MEEVTEHSEFKHTSRAEAEEMVARLTANPNLSNGTKVFAAGRGNYATTGSALSETALSNARKAMRMVKGVGPLHVR